MAWQHNTTNNRVLSFGIRLEMMTVTVGHDDDARLRILMTGQQKAEHIGTENQRYLA